MGHVPYFGQHGFAAALPAPLILRKRLQRIPGKREAKRLSMERGEGTPPLALFWGRRIHRRRVYRMLSTARLADIAEQTGLEINARCRRSAHADVVAGLSVGVVGRACKVLPPASHENYIQGQWGEHMIHTRRKEIRSAIGSLCSLDLVGGWRGES